MPLENQTQIDAVFREAVHLEAAERDEFLRRACAGDDALRDALERRIAAFRRETRLVADELDALIGRSFEGFRIVQKIGRGGMGDVYLAERAAGALRQEAAVKFVRRGMDTDELLRRFRNERQILAALNHPNVARLLGGGTADDGAPYFIMEYVPGEPLFRYCGRRRCDLRARLEIFRQICAAVHAAHRLQIVHRDLKPSNILVKQNGTPKLLDFGIAKLLDPPRAAAGEPPADAPARLMTPEYASPEQLAGDAVTPASDIFSLGVLLYELVAGARPHRFKSRAPAELARVVGAERPAPPSSALGADELRGARLDPAALDRVTLKALRRNAAERYPSGAALGADIARLIAGRPVAAEAFADDPR